MTDINTEIIKLLKLPDKDFFKTRIKMREQATTNTLKQRKYKESQQRNRRYKEESNGNCRTEKYNNPNKMDGWQKRRGQRRESVNWNIEQQKLPNLEKERK